MQHFALLIETLGNTTKTSEKLNALVNYFSVANQQDKIWVLALFTGRRPKRTITSTLLKNWCAEFCNLPLWLVEECHHTVGDLSETIALLIEAHYPKKIHNNNVQPLHFYVAQFIQLAKADEATKKNFMLQSWENLNTQTERFVFNKLLSGAFRIGVSQQLMVQALAKVYNIETNIIAHRITGKWDASTITLNQLLLSNNSSGESSKPYPFYLAYALDDDITTLGNINNWQIEWKWDGIRGQIIKRSNTIFVWSRGEELITEKFPEFETLNTLLPNGIVLDGEILAGTGNAILPFSMLQTRLGRKNITKKILQNAPAVFYVYDVLEYNGNDIRHLPLHQRRAILSKVITPIISNTIQLSPLIIKSNWQQITELQTQSRANNAEGFMIKQTDSIYQTGRKRGHWWKWKIAPLTIDAVLIYAQKGSGRRSNLYTDYTFAVADGEKLVTFTKAYTGLTDKEFAQVDAFVKANSLEKFGPVRTVKPELVFEIAFEGISKSSRHKSGVALRFPRIKRWRTDKKANDINTLEDLNNMLILYGN